MENIKENVIKKIQIEVKSFFKKDIKMKLLVSYLTVNLLYLLIGSYIYYTNEIINWFTYKEFAVGLWCLFITNTIVFLAIIINKARRKELKDFKNPAYFGIALCAIFAIISTIFAYDPSIALEGCFGRYEGLFSIFYYLTIMLLCTFVSKKYKKFLIKVILICGAIQALYAICQVFSLFNVKQYFNPTKMWDKRLKAIVRTKEIWALGFTNNPNFLGAYMLLCLSYTFGLFIDEKKKIKIVIYAILSILFVFAILISNATSVVIGLLFVLAYILVYCLKNKNYIKLLTIIIIIVSTTFLGVQLGKTTLLKDFIKLGNETTEVAKGNLDNKYGTKRMYIWKETMKIVPNYLLHGVGVDSFHKAFNGEALVLQQPTQRILYDKAHNEYLQTLVTQGIFALTSYVFMYGYAIYIGTQNSYKFKQTYLVLPVIGYLVQAFFNISVIEVAPIFYIALGLCCGKENNA